MSTLPPRDRRDVLTGMSATLMILASNACSDHSGSAPKPRRAAAPANAAAAGSMTVGDLTVHRLGFGAMRITGNGVWGAPKDPQAARAVLRRAIELGVNFIDTADAYGPNVSEQLIYEALYPYPQGLVIATKGGYTRTGPDQWVKNGHPGHLREACENSLQRLHLERIDLYQYHTPDPQVPIEESIGALARLQQEGKIRHIGVSNFDLTELKRARTVATWKRGAPRTYCNTAPPRSLHSCPGRRSPAGAPGASPPGEPCGPRRSSAWRRRTPSAPRGWRSLGSWHVRPRCCRSPGPPPEHTSRTMSRRRRSA